MKTESKFSPIIIEIVIESEQELCDLWHRMNASKRAIDESSYTLLYPSIPPNSPLFEDLDKKVNELNLVKL